MISVKLRLYPSGKQEKRMSNTIETCGRLLDRDINAAKVVPKRGLALIQVGRGTPGLKPAETGHYLLSPLRRQARSMKQELHAA